MKHVWISPSVAARYVAVLPTTVRRWARTGQVEARRIERDVRISSDKVRQRYLWQVELSSLRRRASRPRPKPQVRTDRKHREECRCWICRSQGLKKLLSTLVTEEQYNAVKAHARTHNVSCGETVRTCIDLFVKGDSE